MNIFSAKNFAESRYFCKKPVYKNIDFLRKKFRLSAKFLAPPTPKTNREPCKVVKAVEAAKVVKAVEVVKTVKMIMGVKVIKMVKMVKTAKVVKTV